MQSFKSLVISPMIELLASPSGGSDHRGGPHWPDWQNQTSVRHNRNGRPADAEPEPQEPVAVLGHPVIWTGPIVAHFGHQIADFSSRILVSRIAGPDVPMCVASRPQLGSFRNAARFIREIYDWFEAPEIVLVNRPVLAPEVLVAPQQEQLDDVPPTDAYLDLLDAHASRKLGEPDRLGVVYVSRAGQAARFAGERYVEAALRDAGLRCFRPEDHTVEAQLRTYAGAETLIFSEGSALHGAQLVGRSLGTVVVLRRRPGSSIARAAIEARARSLSYRDVSAANIHALRPTGQPAAALGVSLLDENALLKTLCEFAPGIRSSWSRDAFEAERDADLAQWLARFLKNPMLFTPANVAYVAEQLRTVLPRAAAEALVEIMAVP